MRFSIALLLALPSLALGAEQVPLFEKVKGFLNKAKDAVTSAVPAAAPSPLDAGAAKVAAAVQHELTLETWKDTLTLDPRASAPTTQDWLVYITGGNTTCYGLCGNTTKAWNNSLPLLASKPNGPKFAVLDCETQPVLCNSWSVGPPSLYYFQIPKPLADQSAPAPTARYIPLNRTSTTIDTLKTLVLDKEYEKVEPYEGVWHPFNGKIQEFGIAYPVGYVLWAFSKMPSWAPMILISFLSRSFMSRRTQPRAPPAPQPAQ